MGKRDKKDEAPPPGPFNNPFAALSVQRDALPAGPPPPEPRGSAPKPEPKGPARAVVRMERKGRGGKEVTVVEQLGLPAAQLDTWLKALKGGLGCGGVVEDDTLVLQGDQRDRLPALLEARGVRKVTVG
ncbi:translation initiation factor [Corallococcus sp. AB049A]|uniref:Translation initiation factor n=1 Tax=Corallococcus interemptor TaxID=2316720 RepID=A0A3A8QQ87_9BACT|nr:MULTISPECIES: translation initiation factor [Corallococcus]RKH50166.1 translation initiation factor [Corallococcus sp. AB050B]RKH69971.1 translation initiation factor [Corallococcus interemptor]RKI46101.1 translation initiation factor [Corallococcus sp. AB049A]